MNLKWFRGLNSNIKFVFGFFFALYLSTDASSSSSLLFSKFDCSAGSQSLSMSSQILSVVPSSSVFATEPDRLPSESTDFAAK